MGRGSQKSLTSLVKWVLGHKRGVSGTFTRDVRRNGTYSGCSLKVARVGGTSDATLSPVLPVDIRAFVALRTLLCGTLPAVLQ